MEDPNLPSSRIADLIAIDKDVTLILRSAGLAIQALTNPTNAAKDADPQSIESTKQAFEARSREFLHRAQAVEARLRRNVYALEEAGIIAAEQGVLDRAPAGTTGLAAGNAGASVMPITNGGLGNLDIGWLNSRKDGVGMRKEAELWGEARVQLERMQRAEKEDDMQTEGG